MTKILTQRVFLKMNRKYIDGLKHSHAGEDIYVLAAGGSMNMVNPSFFEGKITVGVNRVCNFFKCDYTVTKDSEGFDLIFEEGLNKDCKVIISEFKWGTRPTKNDGVESDLAYYFDHFDKPDQRPMCQSIDKSLDKLVVSHSTITSAIHFAAYIGAKNIFICGHDCALINNKVTIDGYYSKIKPHQETNYAYFNWLKTIKNDTINVCNKISSEYGCNIVAINPMLFLDGGRSDVKQ